MSLATKALALLEALRQEDIEALPPAHLSRFSELCRHWHQLSDKRLHKPKSKSGILASLYDGARG